MAMARAICTCSTCGNEFTKSKQCRNRREADNFEQWAKDHLDTCPECYRKFRHEREAAKGLLVSYSVDLDSAYNGELCEIAVFSGDSYNQREKLKELGCKYSYEGWKYSFPITPENPKNLDIESKIESELGAKKTGYVDYERQFKYALKIISKYNEKMQNMQNELDSLGEKPAFPEEFTKLRNGRRWNGTIYGKNEKSVYFDGEKVMIDSELAKEVQEIVANREEWSKKKKAIENKYK